MKKYISNLEEKVSSVLNESLISDAAELVGIEEEDAEERIKGLSFANYIELGNAIDLEDAETVREILSTVAPIEETASAGGTGAGAVGVAAVGGDIGTWDGKAHKKPKKGLKNAGKGIYEDDSEQLYHVTHTKYVPQIQKSGLRPLASPTNWVQQGSGERYGSGEIYIFTSREDAKKWAARMDWDFNQTIGSGEIAIVTLNRPEGQDFEKDEADPMSQAGQQGDWLKTYEPIEPENIVDIQVFKSMTEADNPYASAPSQGSSVDALAQQTKTAQPAKTAGEEEQNELQKRKEVDDLTVGDNIEVIDIDGDPAPVTVKTPRGPGDTLVVQTDKGEEHIVKKQAVSGTPTIQEMYESALTDRIVEVAPPGMEDWIKKRKPEFKKRYGDDWEQVLYATAWKQHNNESIEEDKDEFVKKLQHGDRYFIRRSYHIGKTPYRDFEAKIIDGPGPNGGYKVKFTDNNGEENVTWYPVHGKLSGRFYDEELIKAGEKGKYVAGDSRNEWPVVGEARNASNTEHSGAKKGKGGYYGRKKDAKSDSNKKRRANDKKAVDEKFDHYGSDARFIPVEFMGKEVGVVWQEGEGDWHAEVSATGASWGMIDSYKDAVELVQDEAAELVNEGFDPATHVNVEHRDPEGRFIIVHVPPAGYWAVGKGKYQHDVDRTSFDNFDDALEHAELCLSSLDEGFDVNEIRRLAGLKETASAGATGAGAVATAPTAMGGMVKRSPSIYDKPKPKKRTKESSDDGLGRSKKK